MSTPPGRETAGSLQHGLAILGMFSESATVIGVSEMARAIGVHRSTASRLAATLCTAGYLTQTAEAGKYRLGSRLVRLGTLAAADLDPLSIGTAALQIAVEQLGETAHLGVREDREVVTAAIVDGWRTIRMHSWVGKRSPAHCSSLGKALLAGLDDAALAALYPPELGGFEARTVHTVPDFATLRVQLAAARARGWTLDDQELELGLRCVGAPVFDRFGEVVAAVSMSGPAERFQGDTLATVARTIRYAAFRTSTELGCPPGAAYWGEKP